MLENKVRRITRTNEREKKPDIKIYITRSLIIITLHLILPDCFNKVQLEERDTYCECLEMRDEGNVAQGKKLLVDLGVDRR